MNKNQKQFECALGFHDFFQEGCVRQCKHCKLVQLASIISRKIVWVDIGVQKDFDIEKIVEYRELQNTTTDFIIVTKS